MKKIIRSSITCIIILIVGILVGFGALCIVHTLPLERMHDNLLRSKEAINYHAELVPGYTSTAIDNYTDSIMLSEAICPSDAPLLERVIYNYQVCYFKGYSHQENLFRYLDGEDGYGYIGYTHYWGGHQVPLKILLQLFDYSDILVINTILHFSMIVGIISELVKKKKEYVVYPFMVAILSIMPSTISMCLQYSDVFYITLMGSLLIVRGWEKIKIERMYIVFLVLGMCTSYFDFLTYPFVSLGVPLVFVLLMMEPNILKRFSSLVSCSTSWCAGYLGMWAGKWCLGAVLLPESGAMKEAIRALKYRGSSNSTAGVINIMDVLSKNMFVYLKGPIMIIFLIVGGYLVIQIIQSKSICKTKMINCVCYVIVGMYPIAWYFVSKNHSYEHAFMAYRELVILSFSVLCMLAEMGQNVRTKE